MIRLQFAEVAVGPLPGEAVILPDQEVEQVREEHTLVALAVDHPHKTLLFWQRDITERNMCTSSTRRPVNSRNVVDSVGRNKDRRMRRGSAAGIVSRGCQIRPSPSGGGFFFEVVARDRDA